MKDSKTSKNSANTTIKHLLVIAFTMWVVSCGEEKVDGVNVDELEEREGVFYLKNSNSSYTGKAFSFHENGQKESAANFKDGKLEGLFARWYKNGQKDGETNFKGGEMDGLNIKWNEDGIKLSEQCWKNGEQNGAALVI